MGVTTGGETRERKRQISQDPNITERGVTGKVKWFNDNKGYGFITRDDGGKEVFVHHSKIECKGYRTLKEGGRVRFNVIPHEKGDRAVNVECLPEPNN
jgi:cold shock protein